MHRLLRRWTRHLHWRTIELDGEVYLTRYYILGKRLSNYYPRAKERLGFLPTLYLHEIHRPDPDRDLHNHPWKMSISLILTRGYIEIRKTPRGRVRRRLRPGMINIIRANDFHRIASLPKGGDLPTWTLFWSGKFCQRWGFLDENDFFRPY